MRRVVGIIPARYGSTRFPGKPLVDIGGKTMIMRVVERAQSCAHLCDVIVATDDQRIYDHVKSHGAKVVMTSPDHPSGTDRCLEAYEKWGGTAEAVLNIQGDEPFVAEEQLSALVELMQNPEVEIATLAKRIEEETVLFDPNKVKVVFSESGRALYFSRQAIPFQKSAPPAEWLQHHAYYKHIGLYAYQLETLKSICTLSPSPLEKMESLEQLRWLENGRLIYVAKTTVETPAIDSPADLEALVRNGLVS